MNADTNMDTVGIRQIKYIFYIFTSYLYGKKIYFIIICYLYFYLLSIWTRQRWSARVAGGSIDLGRSLSLTRHMVQLDVYYDGEILGQKSLYMVHKFITFYFDSKNMF